MSSAIPSPPTVSHHQAGKVLKYGQEDVCQGKNSEMHRNMIDTFKEQFGDSIDPGKFTWGNLSNEIAASLSKTVFSVASFKGDVMLCACPGIVIRSEPAITTLLTSANLVRCSHDENRIEDDFVIRVCYESQHTIGWLGGYDLDHNLIFVNIHTPSLPMAHLDHQVQLDSCSKGGTGWPLIDLNGCSHAMGFYGEEETPFLPRDEKKEGDDHIAGMVIMKYFENCKLDPSKGDVLDELTEKLASQLSQSVVSLASFNGKTMRFACSGIFIKYGLHVSVLTSASLIRSADDENKIDHNLQIKVYFPNGWYVKGTLQYCNLQYNIAVVNTAVVPKFCPLNIYDPVRAEIGCKVVAIGRIFNSGRVTSTHGIVAGKENNLDCDGLMSSTCKIAKDGTGGPIVDFNGNFIGMNFYSEGRTPFLPGDIILELKHMKSHGIMFVQDIPEHNLTRSAVPEPYWLEPSTDEHADPLLELALQPMNDLIM